MLTDLIVRLNNLRRELSLKEKEYQSALLQDKEFSILKELKVSIKELKRKILLYTEAADSRNSMN